MMNIKEECDWTDLRQIDETRGSTPNQATNIQNGDFRHTSITMQHQFIANLSGSYDEKNSRRFNSHKTMFYRKELKPPLLASLNAPVMPRSISHQDVVKKDVNNCSSIPGPDEQYSLTSSPGLLPSASKPSAHSLQVLDMFSSPNESFDSAVKQEDRSETSAWPVSLWKSKANHEATNTECLVVESPNERTFDKFEVMDDSAWPVSLWKNKANHEVTNTECVVVDPTNDRASDKFEVKDDSASQKLLDFNKSPPKLRKQKPTASNYSKDSATLAAGGMMKSTSKVSPTPFHCICGAEFSSAQEFVAHKISHRCKPEYWSCDSCSDKYRTKEALETHVKKCHTLLYKCCFMGCQEVFESEKALKSHKLATHAQSTHVYGFDDSTFNSPDSPKNIPEHQKHKEENSEVHEKVHVECQKCRICQKECANSIKLKAHEKIHYKRFGCHYPGCEKKFRDRPALNDHVAVHSNEQRFECTDTGCDRRFKTKAELMKHKKSKSQESKVKRACDTCNKTFCSTTALRNHQKVHLKKPFHCSVSDCRRNFTSQEFLDRHILDHRPERTDIDWSKYEEFLKNPMDKFE